MPEFGQNFRTQILVGLKAEGVGEADRIAQEMARLERAMGFARERFRQTITDSTELRQELAPLKSDFNALAKELDRVQAATAAQVAEQARLISSTGAWGAVLRQSGANMATYARQIEEESGKATQKQIADADKATAAVAKLSNETNALLDREAAATEAAEQRKAQARAKAEAQDEAEMLRHEKVHDQVLAAEEAADERRIAAGGRVAAAQAQVTEAERARAGAAILSEIAVDKATVDAEKRAKDRVTFATETARRTVDQYVAQANAHRREMQKIADDAEDAARREIAAFAEVQRRYNEIRSARGTTPKEDENFARESEAHAAAMAKIAADAEKAAQRRSEAFDKSTAQSLTNIEREVAANREAMENLQRQKDDALRREANRRRNADATFNEGMARRQAQQQIEALERIGAQEQSNVQLYRVLDAELQALIAKGSTRTSEDFDRIDAIKGRMRELLEVMNTSGPIFARATSAQSSYNQVINAGAAYAARNATEQARHGTVLEYVSGLVQRMAGRTNDLGHGMDQARGGAEKLGYSILHVAHAVQDAQYGVGAVLNNIPLVVQAFGGGPGLAGGIMIAAVAFDTLYNNWGKIEKFFGSAGSGVLTPVIDSSKHLARELSQASSELEKLASKTRLSLPELEKFRELQEKISAIEAEQTERRQTEEIRKIEAEAQTDAGAAFKKAITQAGGGEQAERDLIQALVNVGDRTGQQYTIQGVTKQAEEMMRDAAKGNQDAIDKIRKVIEEFMPSRDRGLADAIQRTDPRRLEEKAWTAKIAKAEAESDKAREREQGQRDDARMRADEALIARHAASFGAQKALGDLIEGQTKKLISEGEKDPARLRAAARATAEAAIRESKFVPEDFVTAVSAKVAEPHVEKAVGEVIGGAAPGQGIVAAAKAGIAAGEAKAAGKQQRAGQTAEKRAGREQVEADRGTIAGKLIQRSGGNISPEQGMEGAEQFQRLVKSGENPARAQAMVVAHMLEFVRENIATAAQISGMNEQMAVTLQQATMQLGAMQAQLSMTEGRMKAQRWQKPAPWNTIPGG